MYIENKKRDVLDKANLVGKNLCQGKNDYKTGGIFYALFLAPKIKYCLTIIELGVIEQHITFKGFNDSKRLLDRSQYFNMLKGKKNNSYTTKILEKIIRKCSYNSKKMRRCNTCKDGILCITCNNQINENKEFEANLNLLKRDRFGHMLPYYVIEFSTFCTKSSIIYSCFLLFILYTLANFFNFSKVYVFNFCSIKRQQDEHLTFLLSNNFKSF